MNISYCIEKEKLKNKANRINSKNNKKPDTLDLWNVV